MPNAFRGPQVARTVGLAPRTLHELRLAGFRAASERAGARHGRHPRYSAMDVASLRLYRRLVQERGLPSGVALAGVISLVEMPNPTLHHGCWVRWLDCRTSWSWCPSPTDVASARQVIEAADALAAVMADTREAA